MAINIIYPNDIPANPNPGPFERVMAFTGSDYECVLYTLHDSSISAKIATKTTVKRMPETPAPAIFETFLFKLWVIASLFKQRKADEFVYTIHALDYSIGFLVSRLLGQTWLIDAFHSPYYHFDFGRERGDYITILRGIKTILVCKAILWDVDLALVMAHSRTEGFAKLLTEQFNIPADRLIAIPDGVDLDLTVPSTSKRDSNGSESLEVYHVGQISDLKGHDMLRGLSSLGEEHSNISLTIIGGVNPKFADQYEQYVEQANIEIELIEYLPHSEVIDTLNDADIGVCTLQPEIRDYRHSHPVKIFEYLAMDMPVVATGFEPIKKIIQDGYNGYTFPAKDAVYFAEIIVSLSEDKQKREDMANNARESVREYDWGRINKTMIAEFRDRYPQ
jgi:glycosyltransferase involved in cell wall biosynthesis